ncbi:hypothetical protein J4727_19790 [Providencia rettgeri]|uniref:Uncharacterized protein n=1 Tax=Providencia rettgeri TaxID=587 RepID=A0A939NCS0_PRORE|nr:hypothetical protein [Providencia rettgeri]
MSNISEPAHKIVLCISRYSVPTGVAPMSAEALKKLKQKTRLEYQS